MPVFDDLNTGNAGVPDPTFGNEEKPTEVVEAIAEQNKLIQDLIPGAEWLQDKLTKAKEDVDNFGAYMDVLGANPKQEDIQAEYRARALFKGLVERIEQEISNNVSTAQNIKDSNNG